MHSIRKQNLIFINIAKICEKLSLLNSKISDCNIFIDLNALFIEFLTDLHICKIRGFLL